jgi:nucleoside-diphosphate kinase
MWNSLWKYKQTQKRLFQLSKMKYTLTILKPDAISRGLESKISKHITDAGFQIAARKRMHLTNEEAYDFYEVHKDKPFFRALMDYMTSGPCVFMVLRNENSPDAIDHFRKLIGSTDPAEAEEGTIRKMYAESLERNSIHGSDSPESVLKECDLMFPELSFSV